MDTYKACSRKPLLARVAISCKGQGFGEERECLHQDNIQRPKSTVVPNYIFSTNKKKKLLDSYYMQDSPGHGEGRRNKRKDLIQAQELIIKTGNVNNAKYTKQNQKKKKVNLQIITPSVEETQLFCLLNTFSFLLRIKSLS